MIPPFNEHGWLPDGIHDCTLDEAAERFGAFQSSDRRPQLWATFAEFMREAKACSLVDTVLVDGSFVTAEPSPNDIDLVLIVSANHDFAVDFQPSEYNVLSKRRVHRNTFGDVIALPSNEQVKLTYRAFFPEDTAKQSFACQTVTLDGIWNISYGLRPNSDENEAKGEFTTADVVSDTCDRVHCRPYVEGKHLGPWLAMTNLWIEWGTARAPSKFCRPTFPELYIVPEKILAQRSSGPDPVVSFDDQHLVFTPASVGFVPWHALRGVRNNSLKKAARYRGERPPRPDLPKREELEETSRRFSVKYLLGVMNSSAAHDFLRANRRSNIHLYPDDWEKLPIPDVDAAAQAPIVAFVDKIIAAKRDNPDADVSALEAEIDQLVYSLYCLTREEIAIIEESRQEKAGSAIGGDEPSVEENQ